jgi:hypothetical protein|tara:strand:- start:1578 stop:3860 length:2283 start_codon:yes stop_codon:yes gene_type:complete
MVTDKLNILKESRGRIIFQTPMDINDEVFHRPGQGLYAWVLRDVYKAMMAGYGDSKPKFGQYGTYAKNGSLPHDTIESYVGTTTDSIVILWAIRFTDEQIKNHTAYDVEQVVGKDMKRIPFGKSTEVFEIDMETLQDKVYDKMYGFKDGDFFRERKLTYSPRFRQEECIAQWKRLVNKWRSMKNAPPLNFLLGAIMRFGKNFTFLEMSKYVAGDNGNVLVITGNPDVFKSLEDDIKGHVNYDGWIYDELKKNKYDWKPSDNNVNVLAVSTQLLLNLNHRGKLVEFLSQFKWTIQGIDEADNKILTELVQEDIIDKIPVEIGRVWITGTFWKLLATGWFNDENSFIYDYIQQQIDRRDGTDKRAIPLEFYRMKVLDTISNQAKWYTDDEGFTLTKLFSFNEDTGKFIHETDVRDFVKSVLGIIPKTKFSPYKIANLKHTLWVLPDSTKAVIRLGDIIEEVTNSIPPEHPLYKTKVFRATGNEVKDINVVKKYMNDYPDVPTVTLTITRFTRGTTVGEWDATLFMNDTDSIEYYFQACFRSTSPLEGKEEGYVFDFNPNRTVEMLMEYATHAAALRGQTNPNVILKEFLDCFNVFSCDGDVEFVKDDIEKFINIIRDSTYSANTLRRSGRDYINFDNIDDDLLVKLMSLSKEKIKKTKIEISKSNLIGKGKNYKIGSNGQSSRKVDFEKKFKNDIVAKISTMMSRLPIICELGYDTVEGIADTLPNNLFYGATKSDKEVLRLLIDNKVIDTFKVNLQLVNSK